MPKYADHIHQYISQGGDCMQYEFNSFDHLNFTNWYYWKHTQDMGRIWGVIKQSCFKTHPYFLGRGDIKLSHPGYKGYMYVISQIVIAI